MTYTVINVEGSKWAVTADFSDEGVEKTITATVIGKEAEANSYAITLAMDFRRNNNELFPIPVIEIDEMEELI